MRTVGHCRFSILSSFPLPFPIAPRYRKRRSLHEHVHRSYVSEQPTHCSHLSIVDCVSSGRLVNQKVAGAIYRCCLPWYIHRDRLHPADIRASTYRDLLRDPSKDSLKSEQRCAHVSTLPRKPYRRGRQGWQVYGHSFLMF
jgi:hypothetical protein